MSLSQPKSWFAFLAGAGLGFLFFLPLAVLGLAYEHIPLFLAGLAAAAMAWIAAAFMGIRLASGIANGRYRELRPLPWREQVW
jgi:hypothetical protein